MPTIGLLGVMLAKTSYRPRNILMACSMITLSGVLPCIAGLIAMTFGQMMNSWISPRN